jgi:hypothetical protein
VETIIDLHKGKGTKKERLGWTEHLVRMDHGGIVKKIFEKKPERRRRMGRPRLK